MKRRRTAVAILIGALSAGTAFSSYRIQIAQFPLDMFGVEFVLLPVLALAFGFSRNPSSPPGRIEALWVILLAGIFLGSMTYNRGVSLHYFVSEAYYPYPQPEQVWIRLGVFFISWISEFGFFFWLGMRLRPITSGTSLAWPLLGAALGLGAASYAIIVVTAGAHLVLILLVSLLGVVLLPAWTRWPLSLVSASFLILSFAAPHAFLTWRILPEDYRVLERTWSPYYYLNFISFQDDHCLGGIYSYLMIWKVCDDPNLVQRELKHFHGAIGRGKKSALVIGRVDGTTALSLSTPPGHFPEVTMVEIDPRVAYLLGSRYQWYNGRLAEKPGYRILSADWRRFIEKDDRRYDVVVLDGLGIALYTIPLTNYPQEGWLFTREAFQTLFDRRLNRDGIVAINWGSTRKEEVYPLVANLPSDVHKAIFWVTFTEYPLTGLPLFLIAASRDAARIESLKAELAAISPFQLVETPADLSSFAFTDDSPLVQRRIYTDVLPVNYFVMILVLIGIFRVGFRSRQESSIPRMQAGMGIITGIYAGISLAWIVSGKSRLALDWGPAQGAVWLGTLWLIVQGIAAPYREKLSHGILRFAGALSPVGIALAQHWPEARPSIFVATLLASFGSACLVRPGPGRDAGHRYVAVVLGGCSIGILLYQDLLLRVGFTNTAHILIIAGLLLLLWRILGGKRDQSVPAPALSAHASKPST